MTITIPTIILLYKLLLNKKNNQKSYSSALVVSQYGN